MINKKYALSFIAIYFILLLPFSASASPFEVNGGTSPTLNEQLGTWSDGITNLAPTVSDLFSALFTIMFLFGAVRLGYSIVTKTGQVMKGSSGLLIWIPITYFSIRVFMLLLFTTGGKGVTLLASDFIRLTTAAGYSTIDWMLTVGLVFFLFFNLIKHPEFGRWSKRMWGFAGVLTLLIIVTPIVLGAV